ncbi:hypothetical protein PoB_001067300 [Plakobranchus ocellatus]|uniref:Uncharacterized protein n=1 Tax=Plakobranchus ocellatus TaxID=259542 RepID=A0AAV3YNM6_9GAST|nr:hypothetical protein PoB_001067300 [Plakobranchus ocellatus]
MKYYQLIPAQSETYKLRVTFLSLTCHWRSDDISDPHQVWVQQVIQTSPGRPTGSHLHPPLWPAETDPGQETQKEAQISSLTSDQNRDLEDVKRSTNMPKSCLRNDPVLNLRQ